MTDYGLLFSHFAVAGEGWLPLVAFGNLPGLLVAAENLESPQASRALSPAAEGIGTSAANLRSDADGLAVGTGVMPAH
jgi:hypothetical protein